MEVTKIFKILKMENFFQKCIDKNTTQTYNKITIKTDPVITFSQKRRVHYYEEA